MIPIYRGKTLAVLFVMVRSAHLKLWPATLIQPRTGDLAAKKREFVPEHQQSRAP